jgi:hypothetical protein
MPDTFGDIICTSTSSIIESMPLSLSRSSYVIKGTKPLLSRRTLFLTVTGLGLAPINFLAAISVDISPLPMIALRFRASFFFLSATLRYT